MGVLDTRIRLRLRAAKPNQQELAKRLGKSQSWVSKYIGNGGSQANIDDLAVIAEFLNMTVTALIDEKTTPTATALQRQAQEIARLWMQAKPRTRRCVREYLQTLNEASLKK